MLFLYNEKPISIFLRENEYKISVEFCNIKMKMKPCQFRLFHRYLTGVSEKINENTETVELFLVKDSLNVTLSLKHYFQLNNAVKTAMAKKFGHGSEVFN